MKVYIGWDVGVKGAVACIADSEVKVWPYSHINALEAIHWAKRQGDSFALIENVHAMPKQGSVSMFNFGKSAGIIEGMLMALLVSYQRIEPRKWKQEFGLIGKEKKDSIKVCQQLFPTINLIPEGKRVASDGMAEALLICEYARRHNM